MLVLAACLYFDTKTRDQCRVTLYWYWQPVCILIQKWVTSAGCLTLLEILEIYRKYFSSWKSWKSSRNLQNLLEIFWLSSCVSCYYDSQFLYFKMYQWKHLAAVTATVSDGWMTL